MSTGTMARSGRANQEPRSPLIDPRLQARRREVARGRGRRRLRRLLIVGGVLAVGGAAYGASRSALLDVDEVRLEGTRGERATAVEQAASIPRGSAMVGVDPGAVGERVAALPWVLDVDVERSWPGTILIEVTERQAVAVDSAGSGIDVTGRSIGPVPGAASLPAIRGASVEVGADLDADHRPVLATLAEVPEGLRSEVESGALVDDDVELVLVDGIRVRFGPSDRHRAKFTALQALLDQAGRSTVRSIDVRVPTSPSLTRRAGTGA